MKAERVYVGVDVAKATWTWRVVLKKGAGATVRETGNSWSRG
jgi:hypothetical protein